MVREEEVVVVPPILGEVTVVVALLEHVIAVAQEAEATGGTETLEMQGTVAPMEEPVAMAWAILHLAAEEELATQLGVGLTMGTDNRELGGC